MGAAKCRYCGEKLKPSKCFTKFYNSVKCYFCNDEHYQLFVERNIQLEAEKNTKPKRTNNVSNEKNLSTHVKDYKTNAIDSEIDLKICQLIKTVLDISDVNNEYIWNKLSYRIGPALLNYDNKTRILNYINRSANYLRDCCYRKNIVNSKLKVCYSVAIIASSYNNDMFVNQDFQQKVELTSSQLHVCDLIKTIIESESIDNDWVINSLYKKDPDLKNEDVLMSLIDYLEYNIANIKEKLDNKNIVGDIVYKMNYTIVIVVSNYKSFCKPSERIIEEQDEGVVTKSKIRKSKRIAFEDMEDNIC